MKISRRNFLKATGFGITVFSIPRPLNILKKFQPANLGRVTSESISVYSQPTDQSAILFQRYRDDILHIYDSVQSEDGPGYNPLWHRVWGGYVHSAFVQNVRNLLNPIRKEFPSGRVLSG